MTTHQVVSNEQWLAQRKALLDKEKAFTKLRDELSAERRDLPWVRVGKNYMFDSDRGKVSLADLFDGKSQLIVYHFMFHPDWDAGCKSCSYWADNYERVVVHLQARDTNLVVVSRAALRKLEDFKRRMGWTFKWVSSLESDFNTDFNVTFTQEQIAAGDGHIFHHEIVSGTK